MVRIRKIESPRTGPRNLFRRVGQTTLTALTLLWPLVVTSSSNTPIILTRDSAQAVVRASVRPIARAAEERGFSFPDDPPGSEAVTILPSDKGALALNFGGESQQSYYLHFPPVLTTFLRGSQSSHPDRMVRIYGLNSSLAVRGILGPSNRASVGATRDRLRMTQKAGTYVGDVPVTLVYP